MSTSINQGFSAQPVQRFGASLGDLASRFVVISAGIKLVQELSQSFRDASKEAQKLGEATADWINSLRDYQTSMTGQPGAITGETTKQQIALMRQTGMTPREAESFAQSFAAEAAQAVAMPGEKPDARHISPAVSAAIQQRMGRYATAMGTDPKEVARIAGKLTQMYATAGQAAKVTPDFIEGEAAGVQRVLGWAPGRLEEMSTQFNNTVSQMWNPEGTGMFKSPKDYAEFLMAVSMGTSVGRAGTATAQVTRGFLAITRGTAAMEAFSKKAGVKPGMDALQQASLIIPALRAELAATGMSDADIEAASKELGAEDFTGKHQMRAVEFVGKRLGIKDAAFARGLAALMTNYSALVEIHKRGSQTTAEIKAGVDKAQRDPAFQNKLAAADVTASKLEQGIRYMPIDTLMKEAYAELVKKDKDIPEAIPAQALADFLRTGKMLGFPTIVENRMRNEFVRRAVAKYGDFNIGNMDDFISQSEVMKAFRDQTINLSVQEYQDRYERRKGRAGTFGAKVEEYEGLGSMQDFAAEQGFNDPKSTAGRAMGGATSIADATIPGFWLARMATSLTNIDKNTQGQMPMPSVGTGKPPR